MDHLLKAVAEPNRSFSSGVADLNQSISMAIVYPLCPRGERVLEHSCHLFFMGAVNRFTI